MKRDPPNRVDIRRRERLVDDFFRVDAIDYAFERYDGRLSDPVRRLVLERGESVAALLVDRERRRVLLIEQFRIATHERGPGWLVEIVAGMVPDDETPEAALRREVLEETGHALTRIDPIATFYLSPGGSSERVWLYVAEVGDETRSGAGGGLAAEGEDIRLVEFDAGELRRAFAENRLADAKTLVAVLWLLSPAGAAWLAAIDGGAR